MPDWLHTLPQRHLLSQRNNTFFITSVSRKLYKMATANSTTSFDKDWRKVKGPDCGLIPKYRFVERLMLKSLEKNAKQQSEVKVKLPIRWVKASKQIEEFQTRQTVIWHAIVLACAYAMIFDVLFLTGHAGVPIKEVPLWFKLIQLLSLVVLAAMMVTSLLFIRERGDIASYCKSTWKLYKAQGCVVKPTRAEAQRTSLIASALLTFTRYGALLTAISTLIVNLDPMYLLLKQYAHYCMPLWYYYKYIASPSTIFVLSYISALTVATFANIEALCGVRVAIVLLSTVQIPPSVVNQNTALVKKFHSAFDIYTQLRLLSIQAHDVARYANSFLLMLGYNGCILAGSVGILGISRLEMSPYAHGVISVVFVAELAILLGGFSNIKVVQEQSQAFKYFWIQTGVTRNRCARRRIAAMQCFTFKVELMGIVDAEFIISLMHSMLSWIVNVVLFATEEAG